MDPRTVARLLAAGRMGLGLALFVAPARAARGWLGEGVENAGAKVAVRGLGARDVAMGAGMLVALEQQGPVRPWLEAGVAADLADAAATFGVKHERPAGRWIAAIALATGAAAIGTWLRGELDER